MDEYTAGTRVIAGGPIVGTVQGRSPIQDPNRPAPQDYIIFDNGRHESVPEAYLRLATEEDEARSAERIRQDEEINRRMIEKRERIQRRRKESERIRQQRKAEEAEAEEEAKRVKAMEYTEEMRKVNGRIFGLESLRRK